MPVSERAAAPSSASPSLELDPRLRDLVEKKVSLKRNVASLAAELKDARNKFASQEQLFAQESETRKVAQSKARSMEEEVSKLQKCLEDKDEQLRASPCSTEEYLHELDDLKSQLSITKATAEASAASAKLAQLQCLSLLQNHDKHTSLNEYEFRVNKVGEQLDHLQKYLEGRELSQRQLKDVVLRTETEIMGANAKVRADKDNEPLRVLSGISPGNIEYINEHLNAKEDDIASLGDDVRVLFAHWKNKIKELKSQLEKHRRTDQDLKKKVLKLEFCVQESRSQMRKLQRTGERRDKALKELRSQVNQPRGSGDKQNFWENSGFKLITSMSMLALVMLSRR